MKTTTHDIIIIGGGMAGMTLACALAQKTALTIAILEEKPTTETWDESCYHHRVSALSLASQHIFQALNVWGGIAEKRVSPFTKIKVWDYATPSEIEFDGQQIAASQLGYIVENVVIQYALQEKIRQYPQVSYVSAITLSALTQQENHVELTTSDNRVFKTKLLIGADGAQSWVRQAANIEIDIEDYHQQAIVTTVTTELPHENTARQVFLSTGPLAFLPLAGNYSSIVWSLPSEEAKRLLAIDETTFRSELTQAFNQRLGEVLTLAKRYAFPLRQQQARHYIKPRIALIGDAAHTVHPLAGQGLNMGLLDAASLAELITAAWRKRRDFSSQSVLRCYERWRKAETRVMQSGVNWIKNIFASDKAVIKQGRFIGLNLTQRAQWLKNIFIRYAVGHRDGLPSLAKRVESGET